MTADILTQIQDFRRLCNKAEHADGLRPTQWHALRHFANAPIAERTVSGFAAANRTTPGTTSVTISALEGRGLLKRVQRPTGWAVEITEAGRALLERDPMTCLAAALEACSADDKAATARVLATLRVALDPEAGEASAA